MSKGRPYDAEIEYLESSRGQYINTFIKITDVFKSELKGYFVVNHKGFDNMLGCTDSRAYGFGIPCAIINNNFYCQFGNDTRYLGSNGKTLTTITTTLASGTVTLDCDGLTVSGEVGNQIPTNTLYMFARNYNNRPSGLSSARIYYCKLYNGGILKRDFIPVRKGQVGYMYDKVSGQLFGNAGTGAFILGPDI